MSGHPLRRDLYARGSEGQQGEPCLGRKDRGLIGREGETLG